jgi:hypothetical protein
MWALCGQFLCIYLFYFRCNLEKFTTIAKMVVIVGFLFANKTFFAEVFNLFSCFNIYNRVM